LIDGWMIKISRAGDITVWLVKGYIQPENYVVAVPYKDRGLKEVPLSYLPCIGREVPLIPRKDIVYEINPFSVFRIRRNELPKSIIEFFDIINVDMIGITGSWALFSEKKHSDVDIIVYTDKPRRLYNTLNELKKDGLIRQCRSYGQMISKVKSHWIVNEYIKNRVLESCYKGVPYTLRILRTLEEVPCSHVVEPLGKVREVVVRLKDVEEAYLIPARYEVNPLKGPSWLLRLSKGLRVFLETWRTRYQELKEGIYRLLDVVVLKEGNEVVLAVDPQGRIEKTAAWSHADN
jgi:hypothetical protein